MIRAAARGGDMARVFLVAGMVEETAARGAALTERMLRAARPPADGEAGTGSLDPRAMVERLRQLLPGMLGAPWRLRVVLATGADAPPPRVRGSEAELEAALLNLCVNARDAMPQGGEIVLGLGGSMLSAGEDGPPEAEAPGMPVGLLPGAYARLSVTDGGIGMDAATLARVGEAFFTTKPQGVGTGLGLAAARAFAQDAGGGLLVESPGPGRGATVTLWLPAA
jgi:two-component system NtrC family sensor kinase